MDAGEKEKIIQSSKSSSLFPLIPTTTVDTVTTTVTDTTSGDPQWLRNTSFSTAFPLPTSSAPFVSDVFKSEDANSDDEGQRTSSKRRNLYDLVASSSSSSSSSSSLSSSGEERKRRKKKRERRKMKKRRKGKEENVVGLKKSGAGARFWMGAQTEPEKEYYFDVRGDGDNLAFGSLYRMDVARYDYHTFNEFSGLEGNFYRRKSYDSLLEVDDDLLDSKLRMGGRYWSARYSTMERDKNFRHVKIVRKKSSLCQETFIPMNSEDSNMSLGKDDAEESWEDEMIKKTREFNKMSREFPHDEKVWIAFADFQDKIASTQPQKAARLQTLEKKISILEKAVDLNPESEELPLYLLKAYERRDSSDILLGRWEKVLMQHFDSCRLWKEFLLIGKCDFSKFKVSDMRRKYAHAIQALSSACTRLYMQDSKKIKSQSSEAALIQLELGLVDVFLSLCRFEWQSGFQELATGLFQAEIEYSLFCPSLNLSVQSKQRLFEHFWNSTAKRMGEDGSLGWSAWIEEEESRNSIIKENSEPEIEIGGWTGWCDPLSKNEETKDHEKSDEGSVGHGNIEDHEAEGTQEEDDIEALLRKLGISVDAKPQNEVKDSMTWNRWSVEESSRDSKQWMPVRENSDREASEELSRTILLEDVREYLFSLHSEEARFCLVTRFIDFFGGRVSQWTCTNSASWSENNLNLDVVPGYILESLHGIFELVNGSQSFANNLTLGDLVDGSNDIEKFEINRFLRNSLLLCLNVFPRNYHLEEALLFSEELLVSGVNSPTTSSTPSQVLAKSLLKKDRQDLLLSGLYARREAAHGNIGRARKIFDMTLSSIDSLPPDVRENRPLLYLWYAEMEMENGDALRCSEHAIHILSFLGSGEEYSPYNGEVVSLRLLKAHNGFKEQIRNVRSAWAHGCITDKSAALVCAASLFEIMTAGWSSAVEVIDDTFSMSLPERRIQCSQLEYLCVWCISLLQRHNKEITLSVVWRKIMQYLRTYPYNPKIISSVIEVGSLHTVPQKIWCVLDEYSQRKPSIFLLLYALSYELGRSCSHHRIRGLFEKALANDKLHKSVILWRSYLAFEIRLACNNFAAKRLFFRAIHACPWSKKLWLDGFKKLSSILTPSELSDLHEVMHEKELHLRTDIYEILLQDEFDPGT